MPSAAGIVSTIVLIGAFLLYFVPLLGSLVYGFSLPGKPVTLEPLTSALSDSTFLPQLWATVQLVVITTVCSIGLLVPTLVWLHRKPSGFRSVAETASIMPLVVPAVALVSGANLVFRQTFPSFLVSLYSLVPFYMVLTMPLVYRSLDAGLRAIDLRTLLEAGTSLGASTMRTVFGVILPNMRAAVLSGTLLCATLVSGEYAMASLLLHNTFPVFVLSVGQTLPKAATALSFIVLLGTWGVMHIFSVIARSRDKSRAALAEAPL